MTDEQSTVAFLAALRTPEDRTRLHEEYASHVRLGDRDAADHIAGLLGIPATRVDAHFAAADTDEDWTPDSFEDFEALPPGRFDARVFDQDIYWVDMLRQPYRITDDTHFVTEHLHAVIEFVRVEGHRWISPADTDLDDTFTVESYKDSVRRTIEETPLMRALLAEADRRAHLPTTASTATAPTA
jgi:hypothetical protein